MRACLSFELVPGGGPIGHSPRVPAHIRVSGLQEPPVCDLAGDAGGVTAVDDDLVVELKGLSRLLGGVEVDRPRDVGSVEPPLVLLRRQLW